MGGLAIGRHQRRHRRRRRCWRRARECVTRRLRPPLPAELEAMMRQLKMPYARALAPELIATARAQRWDPAEIIKALFVEESRRPVPVDARHPPQSGRVPDRENLRHVG